MVIRGTLQDKHFVHIDEIIYGQVFANKKNEIFIKVEPENDLKEECYAVNLKHGKAVYIDKDANLRLLNCSLDIHGFVIN